METMRTVFCSPLLLLFSLVVSLSGHAQGVRLEAEQAHLEGPDLKAVTGSAGGRQVFSGTGYVTGFENSADRLVFRFSVRKPGLYRLVLGYRATAQKGYDLEVNGSGLRVCFRPAPATVSPPFPLAASSWLKGKIRSP